MSANAATSLASRKAELQRAREAEEQFLKDKITAIQERKEKEALLQLARTKLQDEAAALPSTQLRAMRASRARELETQITQRDEIASREQAVVAEIEGMTRELMSRSAPNLATALDAGEFSSTRKHLEDERLAVMTRLAEVRAQRQIRQRSSPTFSLEETRTGTEVQLPARPDALRPASPLSRSLHSAATARPTSQPLLPPPLQPPLSYASPMQHIGYPLQYPHAPGPYGPQPYPLAYPPHYPSYAMPSAATGVPVDVYLKELVRSELHGMAPSGVLSVPAATVLAAQSSPAPAAAARVRTPAQQDPALLCAYPYSPTHGLNTMVAFIDGAPLWLGSATVFYSLFDDCTVLVARQPVGSGVCAQNPLDPAVKLCALPDGASTINIQECHPGPSVHFLFEVEDASNPGHVLGWTKLYLFADGLAAGRWRLACRRAPVASVSSLHFVSLPPLPLEVCVCVTDARVSAAPAALLDRRMYLPNGPLGQDVSSTNRASHTHVIPAAPASALFLAVSPTPLRPTPTPAPAPAPAPASTAVAATPVPRSSRDRPRGSPATVDHARAEVLAVPAFDLDALSRRSSSPTPLEVVTVSLRLLRTLDLPVPAKTRLNVRLSVQPSSSREVTVHMSRPGKQTGATFEFNETAIFEGVALAPGTVLVAEAVLARGDAMQTAAWACLPLRAYMPLAFLPLQFFAMPVQPAVPDKQRKKIAGARLMLTVAVGPQLDPRVVAAPAPVECPPGTWIARSRAELPSEPYTGDGFDLYVDGVRFLPCNISVTKVVGRVFGRDYTRHGPDIAGVPLLDSDAFSPSYDCRVEFRDVACSPGATVLLKIYTLESYSRELVVVGYIALPIFLVPGTERQPADGEGGTVVLNAGAHQCRIYRAGPDTTKALSATCLAAVPVVPGASLLVRLVPAPRSAAGTPLSIAVVPEAQWASTGLVVRAPPYSDGVYLSDACRPTADECQILTELVKRKARLVRDMLSVAGDGSEKRLKNDAQRANWIKNRLTRATGAPPPVDMTATFIIPYSSASGFAIAVDTAIGLPRPKLSHAFTTICPPAALYAGSPQDPSVAVTKTFDFADPQCTVRSVIWADGMHTFTGIPLVKHTVAVIDVRGLELKGPQFVPQGWAVLQLFTDDGFVHHGRFLLPLYDGTPPLPLIAAIQKLGPTRALSEAEADRTIRLLDDAWLSVRLADGRRTSEIAPADSPDTRHMPRDKVYRPGPVGRRLAAVVPAGMTPAVYAEQIAQAFTLFTGRQ